MRFQTLFSLTLLSLLFAGCSPDRLEVTVSAKTLENALRGKSGQAKVFTRFELLGISDENVPKAVRIVLSHLGEGAKITTSEEAIQAWFKIPIIPGGSEIYALNRQYPMILFLENGKLSVKTTQKFKEISDEIQDLDFTLDLDLKAEHFVFKLRGQEDAHVQVKATAAFVDKIPYVVYEGKLPEDDDLEIEFNCSSEGNIYHQIPPFVEIR